MQNQSYRRKKSKSLSQESLVMGILEGDFMALGRGITICESKKESDHQVAAEIVKACLAHSGNSIRIGITGVPGVGKSTFIESFGLHLIEEQAKRVAVLAVDPTSSRSRGSILGDKTRMEKLSTHKNAFIRPSPSSGALGGVAHHSRESIILCEAAGFDIILVETVGVGQSETEVKEMTDFFLLLMLAGAGDELQGIKRGIMEMADGMLINKADGNNLQAAKNARREYQNALHLFPANESGWAPKAAICSAIENNNIDVAWKMINDYEKKTKENGFFQKQRQQQLKAWFLKSVDELLHRSLFENQQLNQQLEDIEKLVLAKKMAPTEAAAKLFTAYKKAFTEFNTHS